MTATAEAQNNNKAHVLASKRTSASSYVEQCLDTNTQEAQEARQKARSLSLMLEKAAAELAAATLKTGSLLALGFL